MYTIEEVAKLLRFHPQTIYKLVRSKKLKSTKFIKEWRILGQDLIDFLNK